MKKYQKGMSIPGMMVVILLVVFFALLAVALVPQYIEYYEVKDSFDLVAKDSNLNTESHEKIKKDLAKRFQMNNIHGLGVDLLNIERKNGKTKLTYNYERRVHLLGNIDVILTFENTAGNIE